jgi:hypothetical protein
MADYGIFGHGSSGNSWFSRKLNDFHDSTKKYDPIGHYSVENPMKSAHWLVEKSSGGLADAGIGEGFNTRLNQEANENGNNFGLGTQRMGVGVGSVIGAMYGGSYLGGGSGSAGGGAGAAEGGLGAGNGAFLGEGVASGIPAWDGAAGGMGLGFNPNGMPQGSSLASDIPGGGTGKIPSNILGGGRFGSGQGQSGMGMYGSTGQPGRRQNLPLYENEKTDQQKLAELLQALEQQKGGY